MRKKTTGFKSVFFFFRLGLKQKSQQRRGEGVGGKHTKRREEGGERFVREEAGRERERKRDA